MREITLKFGDSRTGFAKEIIAVEDEINTLEKNTERSRKQVSVLLHVADLTFC